MPPPAAAVLPAAPRGNPPYLSVYGTFRSIRPQWRHATLNPWNRPCMTLIQGRPVGVLNMVDSNEGDQNVLAVPTRNPRYDQIHTLDQIFPHVRREIEHFFTIYKELQGALTRMEGWGGPREARRAIIASRE